MVVVGSFTGVLWYRRQENEKKQKKIEKKRKFSGNVNMHLKLSNDMLAA